MPNVATIGRGSRGIFGRGTKPGESFKYTTMFFFGMKRVHRPLHRTCGTG